MTASIVDEHGVVVPRANGVVSFTIGGPGAIAAVDNADDASHESFQGSRRSAYNGRCVAIVKSTATHGQITITATAPGLAPARVALTAAPGTQP